MQTFLIFTRSDRHEWSMASPDEMFLDHAIQRAQQLVTTGTDDRAVVMEVSGVDAMPTFTFRYGARK